MQNRRPLRRSSKVIGSGEETEDGKPVETSDVKQPDSADISEQSTTVNGAVTRTKENINDTDIDNTREPQKEEEIENTNIADKQNNEYNKSEVDDSADSTDITESIIETNINYSQHINDTLEIVDVNEQEAICDNQPIDEEILIEEIACDIEQIEIQENIITESAPVTETEITHDNIVSEDKEELITETESLKEEITYPQECVNSSEIQTEKESEIESKSVKILPDISKDIECPISSIDREINLESNEQSEDLNVTEVKNSILSESSEEEENSEIKASPDSENEVSIEEDSKQFVEKLKILKGNLLARHIIRDESYSVGNSIDTDDSEFDQEKLVSKPVGKTLEEELREAVNNIEDTVDGRSVETNEHNEITIEQDTDKTVDIEAAVSNVEEIKATENKTLEIVSTEHHKTESVGNACSDEDGLSGIIHKDIECSVVKESLTMPETRESMDGSVSPSMMFASCRYRWEKTIVTESPSVVFVTINNKDIEPIKLVWDESSGCFYSDETKIPVGSYVGHLVVDGSFYPVEDILVKHYTFEVDLYLKDDIIEDEAQKSGVDKAEEFVQLQQQQQTNGHAVEAQQEPVRTQSPGTRTATYTYSPSRARMEADPNESTNPTENGIHVTSKYEDLLRSQMNGTKKSLYDNEYDADMNHSIKSGFSDLDGRRSPVGDDGAKQYQDGEETSLKTSDLSYGYREDAANQRESFNKSIVEDDVERQSIHSGGSRGRYSDHGSPGFVDDVLGNGHTRSPIYSTESPIHSRHSSAHSSARQTPTATAPSPVRPESVGSNRSGNSVSRHIIDDLLKDSVGRDQKPTPTNSLTRDSLRTPPPLEQIGDVLNPTDRHSPIRRDYFTDSPRHSQGSAQNSAHSSQRQTPQRELISDSLKASQERLYMAEETRSHGSGSRSNHGSEAGSRPQSLTSEQELSQYYENNKDSRLTPVIGGGDGQGQRTGSASSLPVIGSQRLTPDNYVRVPSVGSASKGPLLPGRITPRTPLSNASSRTITPVSTPVNTPAEGVEMPKEQDTTLSNLRIMLAVKDQEVVELKGQFEEVKDINNKLQGDLDRLRARASPGPQIAELERKYHDAVDERERLSSEVVRLREDLRQKDEPSLNRYNPNSPTALQRKIDEMNSQIQDLHEVNETTVEERNVLERKMKDMAAESETLKSTQSAKLTELEENNRYLKSENQRLKESPPGYSEVSDYRYRIELQQVKEDNRSLRDRNYQLHDDNIRLKEELSELRKSLELVNNVKKQDYTGAKLLDKTDEKDKLFDVGYQGDRSRDYRTTEVDRSLSEDRIKYSYKRSSRYNVKQESTRLDNDFDADRITKSESTRYESYRIGPDGGSGEKTTRSSAIYDTRSLTPERPSALGPPKKYERFDRVENERSRKERYRTTSADLDFRSMPISTYSDVSKTTPALTGRSREIYQELSDKRAANRSQVPDNTQTCESEDNKPDNQSEAPTNSNSLTSKVFVNRYVPQNKESDETTEDDKGRRLNADRLELIYTKSSPSLLQNRSTLDRPELEPRPASAFLDDGDMSDTPTDILVSVQPLDRMPGTAWTRGHNRRGSVGSDASNSSFSDLDEQLTTSVRKRSKSADGREVLRRMMPTGSLRSASGKGDRSLTRTLSPAPPPSGHRSVTPRPLVTQHNKTTLSLSSSIGSLTHGLRPFAPRSAGDLQVSDVIKFSRQGGKLSQGTIKFIGHLPGRGDIYLGVELDKEDGKHDGVFEGIRYFKCKPSKGVFVAYNKVVMAWTA